MTITLISPPDIPLWPSAEEPNWLDEFWASENVVCMPDDGSIPSISPETFEAARQFYSFDLLAHKLPSQPAVPGKTAAAPGSEAKVPDEIVLKSDEVNCDPNDPTISCDGLTPQNLLSQWETLKLGGDTKNDGIVGVHWPTTGVRYYLWDDPTTNLPGSGGSIFGGGVSGVPIAMPLTPHEAKWFAWAMGIGSTDAVIQTPYGVIENGGNEPETLYHYAFSLSMSTTYAYLENFRGDRVQEALREEAGIPSERIAAFDAVLEDICDQHVNEGLKTFWWGGTIPSIVFGVATAAVGAVLGFYMRGANLLFMYSQDPNSPYYDPSREMA